MSLAVETVTSNAMSYEITFGTSTNDENSLYETFVCVVDVPSYMIPRDILNFFGSYLDKMKAFQVFRHVKDYAKYAAIIELTSAKEVQSFIQDFSGQHLSSLEEAICEIVRIKVVDVASGGEQRDFLEEWRVAAQAETCPLCLEPLLGSVSVSTSPIPSPTTFLNRLSPPTIPGSGRYNTRGYFSTCCKHSFHIDCISKLLDPQCPVCRFQHDSENEMSSHCTTCGWRGRHSGEGLASAGGAHGSRVSGSSSSGAGGNEFAVWSDTENGTIINNDLWMCLVCGYVGCGQSNDGFHIQNHYNETLHAYVLNLDTKRVWDFAGNGYVHRLVMSRPQNSQSYDDLERASSSSSSLQGGNSWGGRMNDDNNSLEGLHNGDHSGGYRAKVVEVADPRNPTSNERPSTPSAMGLSSQEEESIIHNNLESVAEDFHDHLLQRMRQRRRSYDLQVRNIRKFNPQFEPSSGSNAGSGAGGGKKGNNKGGKRKSNAKKQSEDKVSWSQSLLSSLLTERQRERGRVKLAQEKLKDAQEELDIVTRLNEMLLQNESDWKRKVDASAEELAEATTRMELEKAGLEMEMASLMEQMASMEREECDAPTGEGEEEEDAALATRSPESAVSGSSAAASSSGSSSMLARRRGG